MKPLIPKRKCGYGVCEAAAVIEFRGDAYCMECFGYRQEAILAERNIAKKNYDELFDDHAAMAEAVIRKIWTEQEERFESSMKRGKKSV